MLRRSHRLCNMGLGDDYVKKVFNTVASKYDMMNDILSLGVHRLWKKHFVEDFVRPLPGGKYLDVAGGTGDIAFKIHDLIKAREGAFGITPGLGEGTRIVVSDINESMLEEGKKRAEREGYFNVEWVCVNGEQLPFENETFDSYTVSFGIRNFSDRPKALREAFRVLKVGGVLNILEFSKVTCPALSVPYDIWSYGFMPQAGRVFADEESYRYLVDSIRAFPDQETFAQIIRDAGFGYVRYESLTGGIACIHTAVKVEAKPDVKEEKPFKTEQPEGEIPKPV
ncbi:ubiquinone biosynthesis methyltransferase [Angomonas deanei]|uniref:2-methoxy-6-polyprenyl-1,4-benzoquinol methylase, mitochondrial n=1 Tax=Angomonas deanei TaxID=59799 RepID=S9U926_9TRYP|nr:ubiquinone biosynthesis methyltransferase [Angomonas deanei]EPY42093.1 ubiquinone biosynthesis methyltransferase [Angomonas deanei]CAD2213131.1 ubiE/COQ5 methyltransferase family/Methyltransferase domain containing protein, putative [Angomonas deanei]|eukprot:EPY27267.1 ubiquinone biosynthesis methyltransferase [Angomonas deanei]